MLGVGCGVEGVGCGVEGVGWRVQGVGLRVGGGRADRLRSDEPLWRAPESKERTDPVRPGGEREPSTPSRRLGFKGVPRS